MLQNTIMTIGLTLAIAAGAGCNGAATEPLDVTYYYLPG